MPKSENETVSINLEPFLMPMAKVISAAIIGVSLIISANAFGGKIVVGSAGTTAAAPTTDTPPAAAAAGTDTPVKTSIADGPILGNKSTAKVAIVEFSDYECPFCKRHATQVYPEIKKEYIDTGKAILVFRNFPLSFHDPMATREAMAAECVKDLAGDGKYYELHDLMYANTTSNGTGLTEDQVAGFVTQIGVDKNQFTNCYSSQKFKDKIAKDIADGTAAGVTGTPGFIVGTLASDGTVDGVSVVGAQPFSEFQRVIDAQLAK